MKGKLYCIVATWENGDTKDFFTDEKNLENLIKQFIHTNKMLSSFNQEAWLYNAEMNDLGFLQKSEMICPIEYGECKSRLVQ